MYKQQRNYENLQKCMFPGVGKYDMPEIKPAEYQVDNWIGFNFARTCDEPEIHGVHFFVDDYQFIRLWTNPDAYLPMLSRFQAVCSPDFSMYTDFPKAVSIYNSYRKHWLAAYWQRNGVRVIPTISWIDESSYDWVFDGEPTGSMVAVSSVGTQQDKEATRLFRLGYEEMMRRLNPSAIIFYGKVPDGLPGNIIRVPTFTSKWRKVETI